jgi:hypothetical protein
MQIMKGITKTIYILLIFTKLNSELKGPEDTTI